MHLFRFSFFIFALTLSAQVHSFSTNECLKKEFNVQVEHKGFPFGLLEVKLGVEKVGCNITISHQKYKYINSQWMIDVCRGPVHIKKGLGAVEVIKKVNNCSGASKDEFCSEVKDLSTRLQDDGLIFATGIKENIESDHGKIYCSFLLLNKYLQESIIFNSSDDYDSNLEAIRGPKRKEVSTESFKSSSAPRPIVEGDEGDSETTDKSDEEEDISTGEGSF